MSRESWRRVSSALGQNQEALDGAASEEFSSDAAVDPQAGVDPLTADKIVGTDELFDGILMMDKHGNVVHAGKHVTAEDIVQARQGNKVGSSPQVGDVDEEGNEIVGIATGELYAPPGQGWSLATAPVRGRNDMSGAGSGSSTSSSHGRTDEIGAD